MHKRRCRVIKDLSGENFEDQCINDYLSTTRPFVVTSKTI